MMIQGVTKFCLAVKVKVDTTNGTKLKQSVKLHSKVKLSVKLKSESGAQDGTAWL